MTFSDLLSTISILTSIIFGFYITHWYSIRDTRTRTVKDYYIEQIKGIKGRVDKFFHNVAWGKSSARKIVSWYGHIDKDIDAIDQGVRQVLDLHIAKFGDLLAKYYQEITGWVDYNDQFHNARYRPSTLNTIKLMTMMSEIDNALNEYIDHVNQANNYSLCKVQKRKIEQNIKFFRDVKHSNWPRANAIWERFAKHIWESIIVCIAVGCCVYLFLNIKKDDKPTDLSKPLYEIAKKQDSICNAINELKDKYSPVEVNTKTFNNSSFFSAGNVDSVNIKLYQRKYETK